MQVALKFEPLLIPLKPEPPALDTLAQLSINPEENLLKKAKRKALTVFLSTKLIELNNTNIKAYRNMYYCNSVLNQEEQELKTAYCKNRFCLVCNAIKTANLINGYLPELKKFNDPQFLTLTIKAVKGTRLNAAVNKMQKDFRNINQKLTKFHKIKINAIRKLECNHNDEKDTYNPHYHIIVDGRVYAEMILNMWLKLNERSNTRAQDIRPADHESMIELFKYATKIVSKQGIINPKALDIIYSAFRRRRVVQPIGIKKFVDEDEREKTIYPQLENTTTSWHWNDIHYDWFSETTGESLTGYVPEKEVKAVFERSEIAKFDNIELKE